MEKLMKPRIKKEGAIIGLGVIAAGGMLILSSRVQADDNDTESKIQIGFSLAPVKLNLTRKDRALVGLGSYLVNGVNDCNACHTSGGPPDFESLPGFNPYNNQRKV